MDKVLIIGGGHIDEKLLKSHIEDKSLMAVDSGYDSIISIKTPDYVIGDMDSAKSKIEPSVKEISIGEYGDTYTDMELAIKSAIDLGFNDITIMGALGKRVDHSLINVFMLHRYIKKNIKIQIIDEINKIISFVGSGFITKDNYKYISILPLYNKTTVTISGTKYQLEEAEINIGNSLTISNEIKEEEAYLDADKPVLIIQSN